MGPKPIRMHQPGTPRSPTSHILSTPGLGVDGFCARLGVDGQYQPVQVAGSDEPVVGSSRSQRTPSPRPDEDLERKRRDSAVRAAVGRLPEAYGLPTPKRLLSLATIFHVERIARWCNQPRGSPALAIGFAEESPRTGWDPRLPGIANAGPAEASMAATSPVGIMVTTSRASQPRSGQLRPSNGWLPGADRPETRCLHFPGQLRSSLPARLGRLARSWSRSPFRRRH